MDKKGLKEKFQKFCESKDFQLNSDEDFLDKVLDGLMMKKEKEGQFFCPCRFPKDDKDKVNLLCPCNFKIQENWQSRKECWCGLFEKKD